MKLISCDGCGVMLDQDQDQDKLRFARDMYAATRRAIVLAAIGKEMP